MDSCHGSRPYCRANAEGMACSGLGQRDIELSWKLSHGRPAVRSPSRLCLQKC